MTIYDRLDDLARIRYPFAENAPLRFTASGYEVTLPDTVFLDASVSAYGGDYTACALTAIKLSANSLHAQLDVCGTTTELIVPFAGVAGPVPFQASDSVSGCVLFGNEGLAGLPGFIPLDVWYSRTTASDGLLAPRCIVYSPRGAVLSITGNAPGSSAVSGDIVVVDGINTRARINAATSEVTIFAEPGLGLVNCLQQVFDTGEDALRVFNGAVADSAGNVTIATDGLLKLEAAGSELHLRLADDIVDLVDCTPLHE